MQNFKKVQICAEAIREHFPSGFVPRVGVVLGTGLGGLASALKEPNTISFEQIPGFPRATVESHKGRFSLGFIGKVPLIMQEGRCHQYEGRTSEDICMGVRCMALLGVRAVILTNAAGAINPRYSAGDLMVIDDHINFSGQSPLTGPNDEGMGVRFPDMSRAYDAALADIAEQTALKLGIRLEKGVYICTPGPQFETPAETRAFRLLGADAVGMSTVQETIALRHLGVRVLGISCLTNKNLPDCMASHTHEQIMATAGTATQNLTRLLENLIPQFGEV